MGKTKTTVQRKTFHQHCTSQLHGTKRSPAFICIWKCFNSATLFPSVTSKLLIGFADISKPNLLPLLHSISLSLCLSDKDTEASCKTCFWHDPQACLSQWGTHSFVDETDRQFKGSSGWHWKGTVNTPQPSQLAAGPLIHRSHAEIPEIGLIVLNACQSHTPQGNKSGGGGGGESDLWWW